MNKWKDAEPLEIMTLRLDGHVFAIEATHVREILDLGTVTEVPSASPFVNGLINVRGKVVPLADLRIKFGMEQKDATVDTRIVVIEIDIDGIPSIVGIRADKVHEVTELLPAALEETPKLGMKWQPDFIRCIGKRGTDFIVVPNIERIFSQTTAAVAEASADRNSVPAAPAHA